MTKFLFKQIDNSSLIVFRIFFGLLCFLESFGAILTGWVRRTLIEPEFTFSFIGFEWLQPLPGNWMYVYYAVMGIFGLLIMVGYRYRFSMLCFALLWSGTYLMQKSSYNNHYYLLFILSFLMVLLPAHRYKSIDVARDPNIKRISMSNWVRWLFILQLFILYTYASLAKLYPDWLNGSVMALLMQSKADYPIIGDLLQTKTMHYFIAYGGILFDGLIIPLLLWKPTRKYAFFAAIFFHIFNSIVFQIGIFPYLALAFSLFFFDPSTINRLFLKSKALYTGNEVKIPKYGKVGLVIFVSYLLIHIALPLRHHFFKDNVLWTEEGHRLAWRMMLRTKSGRAIYTIEDKKTKEKTIINLKDYLTLKQQNGVSTKPDFIWQFAQYLKKEYAKKGQDIGVYAQCYVSVNGKPRQQLVNPKIDLTEVSWEPLKHSDWLLPSK